MRLDLSKVTLESLPRQEHSYRPIAVFLGLHLQRGRQASNNQTRWHVEGGVGSGSKLVTSSFSGF